MKKITKKLKDVYFNIHTLYNKHSIKKCYEDKMNRLTNKKTLTKTQKEEIINHFKKYKKIKTDFHAFYTEKTGIYDINYLPDDLYYCDIDMYYNDWKAATILDNKCFYKNLFTDVEQPKTVIMRINNFWYNENMEIISYEECVKELKQEKDVFIKKATESAGGKGVTYLKINDKTLKEEFKNIIKDIKSDIIVQKSLKQHKTLSNINKTSVNTIRILSLLTDKDVKIYSSILRMGINGAKVDNASSGGITCGIENNGRLKKFAYTADGQKFDNHPTSGINFGTIIIPKFNEMKEMVKKLHPKIPHFRLVSWDIALDENENIILIEANLKYGELDFHQLNNGPVFGKDTNKILDEVFNKKTI